MTDHPEVPSQLYQLTVDVLFTLLMDGEKLATKKAVIVMPMIAASPEQAEERVMTEVINPTMTDAVATYADDMPPDLKADFDQRKGSITFKAVVSKIVEVKVSPKGRQN